MPTKTTAKPETPPTPETADTPVERSTTPKGVVFKVGNLTKDPELAFAATGTAYAKTRLAVDEPKEAGNWQGEKVTSFYDVTLFGTLAENFAQSCPKGTRVVVAGRAEMETWTDKNGEIQTSKKILADGAGPDLRWSTCEVTKVRREAPRMGNEPGAYEDEEPF